MLSDKIILKLFFKRTTSKPLKKKGSRLDFFYQQYTLTRLQVKPIFLNFIFFTLMLNKKILKTSSFK